MTTTTPTYDEGIIRGAQQASARGELWRLRDCFDRDRSTVAAFRVVVNGIIFGLGNTAASEGDQARRLARELHEELGKLELAYGTQAEAYRSELGRAK